MIYKNNNNDVNNTRKPWVFIGSTDKIFISLKQVVKHIDNNKWIFIDTITKGEYDDGHFKNSLHVSFLLLKKFILQTNNKKRIVLISRNERTYLKIISWAKAKNYKHIFLLKGGLISKLYDEILITN